MAWCYKVREVKTLYVVLRGDGTLWDKEVINLEVCPAYEVFSIFLL